MSDIKTDPGLRARAAEAILTNPLFDLVVEEMGQMYYARWSAAQSVEEREAVNAEREACDRFVAEFRSILRDKPDEDAA